jgi:hypothetical protein
MKKLKLTGVDIGAIVAFVVITLAGVGGWYYLSGNLATAQQQATDAYTVFQNNSTNAKYKVVVSHTNEKTLHNNIDVMNSELDPLITGVLQADGDKLSGVSREDPVAWKHDLDDEVRRLTTAAHLKSVALPANFYFGFGRYRGQSPGDDQTQVLTKQLLGIHELATILIDSQVASIGAIRRTYEEGGGTADDPDYLTGRAYPAPNQVYQVYPFQVEFVGSPEDLRPFVNKLIQSPYILILRSIAIESTAGDSPKTNGLDQMAGASPGGDNSGTPKGPQFLFGNATLKIVARVDMIEWLTPPSTALPPK